MASPLFDMVRYNVAGAPGLGPITLGSVLPGFQSLAAAGAGDGDTVSYSVQVPGNIWEVGHGTYNAAGNWITRGPLFGSSGASPVNVAAGSVIWATFLAEDLESGGSPGGTAGQVQYNNAGAFGGVAEGTAGQVLTSNGAGVPPSMQDAGGGGGNAIEPETGPSIKISAFPGAPLNMGGSDIVSGLQDGANVNFTQSQLLTGQDGAAIGLYGGTGITGGSYHSGGSARVAGGSGYGTGFGGKVYITGGQGGTTSGNGGDVILGGGTGYGVGRGGRFILTAGSGGASGTGGYLLFQAGMGNDNDNGGYIQFVTANATATNDHGGDFRLDPGLGNGAGRMGLVKILRMPDADPGVAGALYVDPITHIVHWK